MTHRSADESGREQRFDEILAEYFQAVEAGQKPENDALVAQYPEFAAELEEFFADKERFDQLAGQFQPAGSADLGSLEAQGQSPCSPGEESTIDTGDRSMPLPGTRVCYFGDYELLEELGHGGMGVVYKARQTSLNRIVAIKMIRAAGFADKQEIRRFHVEAEAVANLDHANIVPLYEVGQHEGQHYFSMAYVDGRSLADELREQVPIARTAAEYVKTAAEAIHYAHQRGVLHRDIKPGNILIDRSGQIRISDFGLAKRIDSDSHLTGDLQVLGTPEYMPPEQARGQNDRIGPTADVYSLGALLYALLTGRPPFHAANRVATLTQVLESEPVPPRQLNPEIARELETITLKCLEKDPSQRFADAKELVNELERFLDGTPILSQPVSEREWIERWATRAGYAILDELGRSENSVVFRARQVSLDRTVALKVFEPRKTKVEHCEKIEDNILWCHGFVWTLPAGSSLEIKSSTNSEIDQRRFMRMAKAISQLQHPNIATVYDFGRFGERPFVVMELVDGGSLEDKVAHSQAERVQIAAQLVSVATAIDYANRAGVIHRNLSPENVLLTADGTPEVTGFGLCQSQGEMAVSAFMSPEATGPFGGPSHSSRTDVYGLGATLYYVLTGRPPFEGATIWETLRQVLHAEPVAPRQLKPFIDRDLEVICLKCLEKDPNERYGTASEFAADLGRYLRGESILARKTSLPARLCRWWKRRRLTRQFRRTNHRKVAPTASSNHVKIVKKGADAIRKWRRKNLDVQLELSGEDLSGVNLHGADLSGANLSRANLSRANLSGTNLSRANLSRANLELASLFEAKLYMANLFEANISEADLFRADLVTADLSGANLSRANLIRADLRGTNLSGAVLREANLFDGADLSGANLSRADLREANFSGANLSQANLREANLSRANLSRANLSDTTLTCARIGWTVFGDVDLSVTKDLKAVLHEGPSTVGVDTLVRSEGCIPDEFLRGGGSSAWQILDAKLYDPALTAPEISVLQCRILGLRARGPLYIGGVFISYSHADAKFVDKVYSQLQEQGVSVWLNRQDTVKGPLDEHAMQAIRANDVILLVLSETSVQSDWIENELDMSQRKEKSENRDVLCPVALDGSWKEKAFGEEPLQQKLWLTLAQKNVLDFSSWNTKTFGPQFEKLLRGMRIYREPKKA